VIFQFCKRSQRESNCFQLTKNCLKLFDNSFLYSIFIDVTHAPTIINESLQQSKFDTLSNTKLESREGFCPGGRTRYSYPSWILVFVSSSHNFKNNINYILKVYLIIYILRYFFNTISEALIIKQSRVRISLSLFIL
jgi:hypothetical protein